MLRHWKTFSRAAHIVAVIVAITSPAPAYAQISGHCVMYCNGSPPPPPPPVYHGGGWNGGGGGGQDLRMATAVSINDAAIALGQKLNRIPKSCANRDLAVSIIRREIRMLRAALSYAMTARIQGNLLYTESDLLSWGNCNSNPNERLISINAAIAKERVARNIDPNANRAQRLSYLLSTKAEIETALARTRISAALPSGPQDNPQPLPEKAHEAANDYDGRKADVFRRLEQIAILRNQCRDHLPTCSASGTGYDPGEAVRRRDIEYFTWGKRATTSRGPTSTKTHPPLCSEKLGQWVV